jgi:hypothetical protein
MGWGWDGQGVDGLGSVLSIRRRVCSICGENALRALHILFELSHQALCLLPEAQG